MDRLQQLGLQLKKIRKQQKLSQEKFAMKIGIERSHYWRIENGKLDVRYTNLLRIAENLDMTLSQLFEGVEEIETIKKSKNIKE